MYQEKSGNPAVDMEPLLKIIQDANFTSTLLCAVEKKTHSQKELLMLCSTTCTVVCLIDLHVQVLITLITLITRI
jgi:hypothetical protein